MLIKGCSKGVDKGIHLTPGFRVQPYYSVDYTGLWFIIKITFYQCIESYCGDKTVVRSSYSRNEKFYTSKTSSLYWITPTPTPHPAWTHHGPSVRSPRYHGLYQTWISNGHHFHFNGDRFYFYCPASRTTLVATRFRVAVICPIIQVPHCIRVFFYFVWFVFINHIFQFYYELCTYCNILDIYLS